MSAFNEDGDQYDWTPLDEERKSRLLSKQPQLSDRCDWSQFSDKDRRRLLRLLSRFISDQIPLPIIDE